MSKKRKNEDILRGGVGVAEKYIFTYFSKKTVTKTLYLSWYNSSIFSAISKIPLSWYSFWNFYIKSYRHIDFKHFLFLFLYIKY